MILNRFQQLVLSAILCVAVLPIFGQSQTGKGVVILRDETVIFGNIEYHQDKELVTIEKGKVHLTYASSQVKLFQYFDKEKSLNRVFKPFISPSKRKMSYARQIEIPEFFELVLADDFVVLRKQKIVVIEQVRHDEKGSILAHTVASSPVRAISYDYYVSHDSHHAELISNFDQQIVSQIRPALLPQIYAFVSDQKLDLTVWEDQYELLHYYQQLKSETANSGLVSQI